jgi:DMSO/TMAO reductase YedYZ molybdopterin-dependent catalytic subunit
MALVGLLVATSALAADAPSLTLVGEAGQERALRVADLQGLDAREVVATEPHGKEQARYRCVPLLAAAALAGAPTGDKLRGPALATFVLVEAADGYKVVFSLAELDSGTGGTEAYVAFEREGKPLDDTVGPFRLVVPTDKRAARWVRQVTRIRIVKP